MKYNVCFLLMLCTCSLVWGQVQSYWQVVDLRFEGIQNHKEDYLQQFLSSRLGAPFSGKEARVDAQRLKNLFSISDASYRLDTVAVNQLALVFEVKEAWTLFPLISIGGVEGNVWWEIGASEINFLGRGMNVSASYRNIDNRSNFEIFFRQPYLMGSRWGLSAGLHRYASVEPLYFDEGPVRYDYTNQSASLGISREFSVGHTLELGGVYFIESYAKNPEQELLDSPGPEQARLPKALAKLTHRFDRINYHYFYLDGILNVTLLESVYNFEYGSYFNLFINDFHYFHRIGKKGNLAFRWRTGLSTNVNSPFAPFVLDSRINIRGSGNRIDRGTASLILNFEYRYSLWESENLAIQGVLFSDIGTWRTAGGEVSDLIDATVLRQFAGPGIRIIYPKAHNAMLRLDYGFDLYQRGERGLVFGFGQYF